MLCGLVIAWPNIHMLSCQSVHIISQEVWHDPTTLKLLTIKAWFLLVQLFKNMYSSADSRHQYLLIQE